MDKILPNFAHIGWFSCPHCFLHQHAVGWEEWSEQSEQPGPRGGTLPSHCCSCKGTAQALSPLGCASQDKASPSSSWGEGRNPSSLGQRHPKSVWERAESSYVCGYTRVIFFHCCLLWKVGKWTVPRVFLTMKAFSLTSNLIPAEPGVPQYWSTEGDVWCHSLHQPL